MTPIVIVYSNLYAAGADAGGHSDHYVLLEGGVMSWAHNSGRLAGASAAQCLEYRD